jgi:hypothetical protein
LEHPDINLTLVIPQFAPIEVIPSNDIVIFLLIDGDIVPDI